MEEPYGAAWRTRRFTPGTLGPRLRPVGWTWTDSASHRGSGAGYSDVSQRLISRGRACVGARRVRIPLSDPRPRMEAAGVQRMERAALFVQEGTNCHEKSKPAAKGSFACSVPFQPRFNGRPRPDLPDLSPDGREPLRHRGFPPPSPEPEKVK
ncbi:hypothetical protein GCM10009527_096110 [Actinomadura nitritigenes]